MVKLHFQTTAEFEGLFKRKNREVTDTIVSAVGESIAKRKKTALLFEVSFDDVEIAYEISLPEKEWSAALQSCLDHYHSLKLSDEQIDTWKLLELIK